MELENELITIEDAAKDIFKVKPSTVRSWINRNQFPQEAIFKIGGTIRIKKHKLQEILQ